jgi:diadenosine tetraphosphate (Ap4A) HIT family hydrolase
MLPIAVPRLVLISGSHVQGRRDLAVAVAGSITAALISSDDISAVLGDKSTSIEDVIVALATRQIERNHNVVVEFASAVDDIAPVLEKVALRHGAKFAPVNCFDPEVDVPFGEFEPGSDLEAAAIEAEVEGSLSVAGGWGFGISVDTSREGDAPMRDVVAYLQYLDGMPLLSVDGCKFCDHDTLRRRAASVLQNEWCMFSAEKIDGRMVGVVTPIRHVSTVFDLTASEWAATGALLRAGLRHLDKEVKPDSFIVGWNTRPVTGGGTPHAQLRIVPYFAPVAAATPPSTHATGEVTKDAVVAPTAAPTVWATVPPPMPAPTAAAFDLAPPSMATT